MMQFKNLKNKLCIVIQYSSSNNLLDSFSLKEKRNNNIQILLEWLNFVGCKIPVIVYCINNFAFFQKLKVSTSYKFISFTDNLRSIEKFVEEADETDFCDKDNDELIIEKVNSFTLYKINYIIVNKGNNNALNKKELKLNLNLRIEDNEMGNGENNKENRKDESSLISKSSSNSESSSSSSDKE